jgi:hypothetical protein
MNHLVATLIAAAVLTQAIATLAAWIILAPVIRRSGRFDRALLAAERNLERHSRQTLAAMRRVIGQNSDGKRGGDD